VFGALTRGYLSDSGLPRSPSIYGYLVHGRISDAGLPSAPLIDGFTDFTPYLSDAQTHRYMMDMITPSGVVRVPISSWQATLQTDAASYVGCVIPNCALWLATINTATSFVISRLARLDDGSTFEVQLATAPVETVQIDQGPTNYTASISGYTNTFANIDDPDARYDRTLQSVRSISNYSSGARVRCSLDWLLRPGQRAFYAETSLIVSYMNMYVTQSASTIQAYMDVGERV